MLGTTPIEDQDLWEESGYHRDQLPRCNSVGTRIHLKTHRLPQKHHRQPVRQSQWFSNQTTGMSAKPGGVVLKSKHNCTKTGLKSRRNKEQNSYKTQTE